MRYRCEILNHGIDGYEVWLHGRNQGRSKFYRKSIPSNPLYSNTIEQRATAQTGCSIAIPPHYLKNYTSMFEHGFFTLDKFTFINDLLV